MTNSEQNVATLRRAVEALNARNLGVLSELVTPDFHRHDYDGFSIDQEGPEAMAETVDLLLDAFPDMSLQVADIIATDDRAVVYVTTSGTHQGEFLGAEPSGGDVEFESVDLYRLEGGKIAEIWPWPDLGGIRRRIVAPSGGNQADVRREGE